MALKQAKGITNKEMGPALSVAMDLKTGKISQIHRNNQQGFMPEEFRGQYIELIILFRAWWQRPQCEGVKQIV